MINKKTKPMYRLHGLFQCPNTGVGLKIMVGIADWNSNFLSVRRKAGKKNISAMFDCQRL
jgi:hypothetical protein